MTDPVPPVPPARPAMPPLPPARLAPRAPEGARQKHDHRRRNVVVAGLVLALIGASGWTVAMSQNPAAGANRYTTVQASRGDVTQRLTGSGTVTKVDQMAVRFPAAGTVTEVHAAVGDTVKRGDVLAVLDDTGLRAKVLQARAEADAANLALVQARSGSAASGMGSASSLGATGSGASATAGAASGGGAVQGATHTAPPAPSLATELPAMPPVAIDLEPIDAALAEADAAAARVAELQASLDAAMARIGQACPAPSKPEPKPSADPTPTPTPEPEPSADPTPSATPEPTASTTPEPSASATPEPTPEPEPSAPATPHPTPEPEPTASATPEPKPSADPEPTVKPEPVDPKACTDELRAVVDAQRALADAQAELSAANHAGLSLLRQGRAGLEQSVAQLKAWAQDVMAFVQSLLQAPPAQPPTMPPGGMPGMPDPGDIPDMPSGQPGMDANRSGIVSAEVALAKARRALASAEDDLDAATLTAPMDGVLSALPFKAGEATTASESAVVVSPTGAVRVTMNIPASSFLSVRPGQVATLRGSGGIEASAEVLTKALVPGDSGSYPVTLVASGSNAEQFAAGTKATVEIEVSSATDVVVVPLSAVTRVGTDGTVRVLAGNDLVETPVKLGSVGDAAAEVLDGVGVGDRLIVADATKPLPNPFEMQGPG